MAELDGNLDKSGSSATVILQPVGLGQLGSEAKAVFLKFSISRLAIFVATP